MAFLSVKSFLYMGGYAHFVWPAFFLAFIALFANYCFVRFQFRRARRMLSGRKDVLQDEITT